MTTVNPYEIIIRTNVEGTHACLEIEQELWIDHLTEENLPGWTLTDFHNIRVWAAGVIARVTLQLAEDIDLRRWMVTCKPDSDAQLSSGRCELWVPKELLNPLADTGSTMVSSLTFPAGFLDRAVERATVLLQAAQQNDSLEWNDNEELTRPAFEIPRMPAEDGDAA